MNHSPSVFVPIEPESNGLTLPTFLSVLAHALVIGLLIYNYQNTEIETSGTLETVMVSPEQLADMQGQILANRAAAASASEMTDNASQAFSDEAFTANSSSMPQSSSSRSNPQQTPVFTYSDDPASQPMLMSEEQHQRRVEQMQEYRRNMEETAALLDNTILEERSEIDDQRRDELLKERQRLQELLRKESNPVRINKPTSSKRNVETTSSSSGKNYNILDGSSTDYNDSTTSSTASGSSRSAASGSRGTSNSEIINLIKRNYNPPASAKGATQRATLTITVNASGKVVNVSASGPDSAVNEAAEKAVMSTGNLPIDTDDPKYPTFTVEFKGTN